MFDNFKRVSTSASDVLVAFCSISKSVENLVNSANHITAGVEVHAASFEKEATFDVAKADAKREQDLKAWKAELKALSA